MKVIGFTGNYGSEGKTLQSYLMADSSILYTGRPFFVPDFAQEFVATPTIVVRMNRLGKCVAPKFAHRYWDAFTAGFTVRALHSDEECLTGLDRAFDGAAIVGDWVSASDLDDVKHVPVELKVDGQVVAHCCLADMHRPLEELIAGTSIRCSIKMGDLLFTGDAAEGQTLRPGNHLTACIGERQVLDVKIRM
jgi:2-keto-4-pentenoate hydratase/2-oxohepta-3-ene-1,7-dioic acid hydratase in catechol pathway